MRVALRVEVRTWRGLREGVPNLMRLFSEFQVRASFLFPLGRDLSGRAPVWAWRQRQQLGLTALAYGTLLPAPELGPEALRLMQLARDNGHDVGLFGLSPLAWSQHLALADDHWVDDQLDRIWRAVSDSGVVLPVGVATPGWQVHPTLLARLVGSRCSYSSLTRGRFPYLPVLQGVRSPVPEIPTTLPTVDEMLNSPGVTAENVHEFLYAESRRLLPAGHVFTVNADREGLDRLSLMEKLLVMWKGQDGSLRALADVLKDVHLDSLPHHQIGWGTVEGATRHHAMQSVQVPA